MNEPQLSQRKLIDVSVAANLLTLSASQVRRKCQEGEFKTAVRPGGANGNWRIDRAEVIQRIQPNGHTS